MEDAVATEERAQRLVFGEVAELYDRYRPGYPVAVFDRIVEFAGLGPGARVLEVGCGTGRATLPLAERGLQLTALEPSPAMAVVARRNAARVGGVRVEVASFEDWPLPVEPYRLLVAAQAWHWVRPDVGYPKAKEALASGGCLALLWNRASDPVGQLELVTEIQGVYRREAPKLAPGLSLEREVDRRAEILANGAFAEVLHEQYPWAATYSASHYVGLLRTQSDHRLLNPAVLDRLLQGIAQVLADFGQDLDQNYVTDLYLARRLD